MMWREALLVAALRRSATWGCMARLAGRLAGLPPLGAEVSTSHAIFNGSAGHALFAKHMKTMFVVRLKKAVIMRGAGGIRQVGWVGWLLGLGGARQRPTASMRALGSRGVWPRTVDWTEWMCLRRKVIGSVAPASSVTASGAADHRATRLGTPMCRKS